MAKKFRTYNITLVVTVPAKLDLEEDDIDILSSLHKKGWSTDIDFIEFVEEFEEDE